MKYAWTLWTKPFRFNKDRCKFNFSMLFLSLHYASKFSDDLMIFTDSFGESFIKNISSKAKVISTLDVIENEDINKWSLSKILTYKFISSEPYIHIDNDIFLFKEQKKTNCDFLTQNYEDESYIRGIYKKYFGLYQKDVKGKIDKEFIPRISKNKFDSCNMGYLQINNYEFMSKIYAEKSIEIFKKMKNFRYLSNIFAEQYLFYCMVCNRNFSIDFLMDKGLSRDGRDSQAEKNGYTHLISAKNLEYVRNQIYKLLKFKDEEKYKKIEENLKKIKT